MKNPIILMSAITGKPTEAQIFEYLKSLKDNAVLQVMLYPRSGCELEYLSEEWFTTIEFYIKAAKKLGLTLWLYDDFNWPSGDAAGRVTLIPEYRLKSICIQGEKTGEISCYSTHNAAIFGEKFFPDLLNEKAVDYFIKTTHQKYCERFSDYFGNVIKGMFTDEPAIGYCCTENSIPYYCGMEKDYCAQYNRDFYTDLKTDLRFFCKACFSLIADKFNTCFLKKIRAWCEDHNLLMVGHLLGDNDPVSSTHQNGNILKCLSTFAIPGVDELHTDFSSNSILPLYGAAEYAATENGAMAELFGIGPCDLSYAKRRCAIFLAACFKINHYFLGCSHLDMRGNLKITDYFSNLSNDQPDFAAMRLLAQEAEKAALYASRDFTPDVYVKYPAEIVAENYASNIDYLPFLELITTLSRHQIQWKYILPSKPCDGVPIIDFGDNLEYIYNEKIYTDADELCKNFAPKIIATTATGDLPKGIFVRHFSDNTFVVLNLFGEESNYLINKKEVFLPKEGVYLSDLEEDTSLATQTEPINTVFSVNYGNNNVTRAVFSKKEPNAEILCEQDFTVILAVRNGEKALLDNKEIPLSTQNNHLLAHGFKALYRTSEPICLTKGEHVISSSNDCKYLPSVFIIGNFNAQTDTKSTTQITLQNRKSGVTANERFCDFGKVDFCAKITVPIGARAIEITDTDLYTTLQINGVLTDEKIYKPYVFKLNPELQGQEIEIKFTQYSSLAPIFGNLEYFTSVIPNKQWAGAPLPQKNKFGFNNLRWVF